MRPPGHSPPAADIGLAQRAVRELRESGYDASFVAMRLPYGVQADETDAQRALDTVGADRVLRIDIKPASDAILHSIRDAGEDLGDANLEDFLLGNIKARQRMIAQYAVAGANRGLVIGTDHAAEALMGFFTKHGDGAADILPLAGLNKRRVGPSPPISEHLLSSFRRSPRPTLRA